MFSLCRCRCRQGCGSMYMSGAGRRRGIVMLSSKIERQKTIDEKKAEKVEKAELVDIFGDIDVNDKKFFRKTEAKLRKENNSAPLNPARKKRYSKKKSLMDPEDDKQAIAYTQKILAPLVEISKHKQLVLPEAPIENRLFHSSRLMRSIPPYPVKWTADIFEDYVETLTKYDYVNPEHSRLAEDILKALFIINPIPLIQTTTTAFNHAIAYFLRKKNLRIAREIYGILESSQEAVEPNLETYNLMLLSVGPRFALKYAQDPRVWMLQMFAKLRERHIDVDASTWNIALLGMPTPRERSTVLEMMQKRNIPLSRRGLLTVVKDVIELVGPHKALEFIEKPTNFIVSIECVNLVVSDMMRAGDRVRAWKYLLRACDRWNIRPQTSTINMLLETMVSKQRLDWMIGAATSLRRMSPSTAQFSPYTFALFFEAATLRSYHSQKYRILEMLWALWLQCGAHRKQRYFRQLAETQSKFDVNMKFVDQELRLKDVIATEEQSDYWNKLCNGLCWDEVPYLHHRVTSVRSKLASQVIGYDVRRLLPTETDPEAFKGFYHTKGGSMWREFAAKEKEKRAKSFAEHNLYRRRRLLEKGPSETFLDDLVNEKVIRE